jgi:hypothetical protein
MAIKGKIGYSYTWLTKTKDPIIIGKLHKLANWLVPLEQSRGLTKGVLYYEVDSVPYKGHWKII